MSQTEKMVTVEGRVAFAKNLFNPNKKGRYTLAVVFDQDERTMNGYNRTVNRNGENVEVERVGINGVLEMVNGLVSDTWKKKPSNLKTPLKIENRPDMLEKYSFMKDRYTLNASNGFVVPVGRLNEAGEWIDINEDEIKAGDYVELNISGYTYDNELQGVAVNINSVCKTRDGEAFYARQSGADMFGASKAQNEGTYENYGF